MSTDMPPQVADMLRMTERIQSVIDAEAHQLKTESFRGADEADTVRVTLDGRQWLTGLEIEPGLLRLGAHTVEQRVNEAILDAQTTATAAGEAEQARVLEALATIAGPLKAMIGETESKPQ